MREWFITFSTGVALAATLAGAKAMIDVNILESKVQTMKEIMHEVRTDVREVKAYLLNNKGD